MSSSPTAFQSAASAQGRQFADQCDLLLTTSGFALGQRGYRLGTVGVEIDRVATSPKGNTVWFEYKGSIQGPRPGLMRTDTLKKAVANAALLRGLEARQPFVVLTSHVPTAGAALAMMNTAIRLRLFDDVICIYDPPGAGRLRTL